MLTLQSGTVPDCSISIGLLPAVSDYVLHLYFLLLSSVGIFFLTDIEFIVLILFINWFFFLFVFIRYLNGFGLSYENWVGDKFRIVVNHLGKLGKFSVFF